MWSVPALAADADLQLFATSKSGKVYLDRASVREAAGYVHYAVRLDLAAPRDSKDGKVHYQSSLSRYAARCEARQVAVTAVTLYDADGTRLRTQRRKPARWQAALKDVEPAGLRSRLFAQACELAGHALGSEPENEAAPPKQKKKVRATLGAGIVASREGMIVTNNHVVDGCAAITVLDTKKKRHPATLVSADRKNDLALLRAKGRFETAATFRDGEAIQAGESVMVVGYPLAAILGTDPNVNFGYVTALAGLRGDSARFQVTAPIHKGNSGGPVIDQSGRVIGIVTSKLNARAVEKRTGDLPQNIGFAVRGEIAQLFLARHDVDFERDAGGPKLENTAVAALGRAMTVLIACRKKPTN